MSWKSIEGLARRLECAVKLAYWGQRGVECQSGEETVDQAEAAALEAWLWGLSPCSCAFGDPASPLLAIRSCNHKSRLLHLSGDPFG